MTQLQQRPHLLPLPSSTTSRRVVNGTPESHADQRSWYAARLALGRRMYAAGIDDGQLGQEIARLEQRTHRSGRNMSEAGPAAERDRLLVQLADLALEDDAPLPGAEGEYRRAREMQEVLYSRRPERRAATRLSSSSRR